MMMISFVLGIWRLRTQSLRLFHQNSYICGISWGRSRQLWRTSIAWSQFTFLLASMQFLHAWNPIVKILPSGAVNCTLLRYLSIQYSVSPLPQASYSVDLAVDGYLFIPVWVCFNCFLRSLLWIEKDLYLRIHIYCWNLMEVLNNWDRCLQEYGVILGVFFLINSVLKELWYYLENFKLFLQNDLACLNSSM